MVFQTCQSVLMAEDSVVTQSS